MKNIVIQIIVSLISGILAIIAGIVTANYTGKAEKRNSRQESRPYLTVRRENNKLIINNVSDNSCYDVECEVELINSFFKNKEETYTSSGDLLEGKGQIACDCLQNAIAHNKSKIDELSEETWGYNKREIIDFWDKRISLLDGEANRLKIRKIVEECESESVIDPIQVGSYLKYSLEKESYYDIQKVRIRLLTNQFEKLTYVFVPSENQYKWENREEIFNKK